MYHRHLTVPNLVSPWLTANVPDSLDIIVGTAAVVRMAVNNLGAAHFVNVVAIFCCLDPLLNLVLEQTVKLKI